jgi:uncharacterized protein YkwD
MILQIFRFSLSLTLAFVASTLPLFGQARSDTSADLGRPRFVSIAPAGASETETASRITIRDLERAAFDLINNCRAESGLGALEWSEDAAKVARLHSGNMASLKFFGHAGADGKMVDERADQLGVKRWKAIGENIAYLRGYSNPTEVAVEKWMLSSGHRANLLNPRWKESAIGVSLAADGTYYFTQVFLERR